MQLYILLGRAKRDPSIISLDMPKLRPVGGTIIVYDCHGLEFCSTFDRSQFKRWFESLPSYTGFCLIYLKIWFWRGSPFRIDQNRALHNDGYRWGRSKGVKLIQSVGNRLVRTYHFLYDPNNPAGDPSFKYVNLKFIYSFICSSLPFHLFACLLFFLCLFYAHFAMLNPLVVNLKHVTIEILIACLQILALSRVCYRSVSIWSSAVLKKKYWL